MHLCFLHFLVLFVFCVIPVVPIMIQICLAPQNDRLNLSFVKYFGVASLKMARNGQKIVIYEAQIFIFFLTRIEKNGTKENFVLCHSL